MASPENSTLYLRIEVISVLNKNFHNLQEKGTDTKKYYVAMIAVLSKAERLNCSGLPLTGSEMNGIKQ